MPNFISSPISEYKVVLYGEKGNSSIGAYIHCYYNSQSIMSCVFYKDEENVPANANRGGRVSLNYPISRLKSVLDVLRNEEPLFFGFVESSKTGYIATHKEPVGEEEQG